MSTSLRFDPIAEAERQWEANWGRDAVASMAAVTSIMRVQQILLARLNAALRPWGLTFPRYEALLLLHYSRRGSLPLGKIGDRLQVHRASVTNVIDRLEGQGLVRRVQHETDRRAVLAEITQQGRKVAREATLVLNEQRFGTAPLRDEELAQLSALLRPIRVDAGDFTE
ncbi:MAG TPA: MarR family transcriptional regulator [Solirubrobacteraceae bacterium]|nr:MarR family transcriptional regulator [Solirubrobacteraceae bacterium]